MLGYYEYSKRQKREAGAAAEAAEDGDGEKSDSEEELLMITEGTPCWGVKTKKGLRGGGSFALKGQRPSVCVRVHESSTSFGGMLTSLF